MPSEAPETEPARTRRSSRPSTTPVATELTRSERRRLSASAAETPSDELGGSVAPVDADVASQPEIVEQVAAAVVETVIAATIQPTLPAPRRRSSRAAASSATPAVTETEAIATTEDVASTTPASDALDVTVVDERRSDDDVAVILQSADATEATTPVALPTSPITLPSTRRSRRRPAAVESDESPAAVEAPAVEAAPAEPTAPEAPAEAAPTDATTADDIADEFEAAARLFAFTGETPVQQPVAEPVAAATRPVTQGLPVDASPRRRSGRRVAAASFSVGVMGLVGLMTVGMTMPVSALASANGTTNVAAPETAVTQNLAVAGGDAGNGAIQAYVAPAQSQSAIVDRADGYSAATYAQVAADSGIRYPSDFYKNDTSAAIQWPFAVGVGITYGFGMRDGVMHEGADFVPGEGAPIQAIADGVVRTATEDGGGYGVMIIIDHKIDGQLVSSRYAHMLHGSMQVKQGDVVHVGEVIGHTGNTGHSFGAHTHFEILMNGTVAIDPITWLRANAGRHSLD
ncbi:peptidoglycan DD-metalloendopeptidase family protein [Microbacterium sp. SLBN-111]|uniref:M23 family metallopeptidase n=1 Tax=Microbacterium sp. SLBN-111 TaxID=3377733 RepID=UPI003C76A8B9